tara:strand:- start:7484 stop:8302 length:819 start_codon:yes stop_codon:yes gene_type:complete
LKNELLIIGCGEIGTALIDGWLNKEKEFFKKINHINILETDLKRKKVLKNKYKKNISFIDLKKNKKIFKYVFLSFKPKDLNSNLLLYKDLFSNNTIFYSLLAGKKISDLKKYFIQNKNIVRVMLNTPISVNMGTIIFCTLKSNLNKSELFFLNLLGDVHKLKDEKFFDLITVLIGSGPAFFYYLLECFQNKAMAHGLNKSFSKKIMNNLFLGVAKLINNSEYDFKMLRNKVTSKGGTTEAAINSLKKSFFKKIINNSINNSIKKAKFLGLKK